MGLFSRTPPKKPAAPAAKPAPARPAAPSARALADRAADAGAGGTVQEPAPGETTITGASLVEWSPQTQAIEVAQANPGLCAVLENAALLYANGQAQGARALLEQGVQTDHDAKLSPLAWLALFDLLQRAGDRAAFDQHALAYSLQFERSAPPWEGAAKAAAGPKVAPGGVVVVTGKLAAGSASQVEGIRRAVARKVAHARLDLGGVTGFDDAGARLLADALAEARRARLALAVERGQKLVAALDAAVRKGRDGGEGAWLLSLELLQWTHAQDVFDERAIEYAVAFEMSPPSWEPPPVVAAPEPASAAAADAEAGAEPVAEGEQLALTGTITGSALAHVARLTDFAQQRALVPVDLSGVDRIDFVCAGALANGINRVEAQRKSVQIVGATPIIRALLLLIGISPRHFVVKKSA